MNLDPKGQGPGHKECVNGDGNLDLVVVNEGSADISVLLGNGDGTFAEEIRLAAVECVAQPGDANGDLQFDQLDIIQVLQSAKFMTGEPATWEEGDWNGDGVFDQLDIAAALETGNYLQGPYAVDVVEAAITGTLRLVPDAV